MKPMAMSVSGLAGIASRHGYIVRHQPQALFNLKDDIGETRDVAAEHPDVVAALRERVDACIARGRSTPGAPQQNDVPIMRQ